VCAYFTRDGHATHIFTSVTHQSSNERTYTCDNCLICHETGFGKAGKISQTTVGALITPASYAISPQGDDKLERETIRLPNMLAQPNSVIFPYS